MQFSTSTVIFTLFSLAPLMAMATPMAAPKADARPDPLALFGSLGELQAYNEKVLEIQKRMNLNLAKRAMVAASPNDAWNIFDKRNDCEHKACISGHHAAHGTCVDRGCQSCHESDDHCEE